MVAVTFSPKSRQDLLDIGDYIGKDSRANARRFVGKLMEQCQRIGNAPLGYTGREDLAPGLRMAAIGRYVIFFRLIDGTVRIERVLHGARDLPAVLGRDSKQSDHESE
ncbi:MAG: type II toxin-antitoxin system RelE/ParE family toxin [Sulfuritalea sp.]|nr:type II toxin-antitoxin system RelE/ParE family toxin [Sulfuritalea sp.]